MGVGGVWTECDEQASSGTTAAAARTGAHGAQGYLGVLDFAVFVLPAAFAEFFRIAAAENAQACDFNPTFAVGVDEGVVAKPDFKFVGVYTFATFEQVVSRTTSQVVVGQTAQQSVPVGTTVQIVNAFVTFQIVVAALAFKNVVAFATV